MWNVPWVAGKKNKRVSEETVHLLPEKEATLRYELLRSCSGMNGRLSRERELFVQQGLLGWMRAWTNSTGTALTPSMGQSRAQEGSWREANRPNQVIEVLTEMVIAVYRSHQDE